MVYSIAVDQQGAVWFGTQTGVSKYDGTVFKSYYHSDGLVDERVYCVAIDGSTIWFGTHNGVSKFDGFTTWKNYTTADGLPDNEITAMIVDADGEKWFGTYYGLSRLTEDFPAELAENQSLPKEYKLHQNYPNPFNPVTTITYELPQQSDTELTIYNTLGQKVNTLVRENQSPGSYTVNWNGKNDAGIPMPSGIYLYYLQSDNYTLSRKMLLLR